MSHLNLRSGIMLLTIGLTTLLPHGSSMVAHAEMNLCDGVWSNQPCKGIQEKKLGTAPELTAEQTAAVQTRSKKRSLLHDSTMQAIAAKREHGIDLSLDAVETVCRDEKTSIEQCREVNEAFQEKLTTRSTQAIELANAKKESEAKPQTEPTPTPPQNTAIVIQERNIYIDDDHRGHHGHHGSNYGYGQHGGSYSAGGAAINIQGTSSNGSVSVGVSAGGSSQSGNSYLQPTVRPSGVPRQAPVPARGEGTKRRQGDQPFAAGQFPSFR